MKKSHSFYCRSMEACPPRKPLVSSGRGEGGVRQLKHITGWAPPFDPWIPKRSQEHIQDSDRKWGPIFCESFRMQDRPGGSGLGRCKLIATHMMRSFLSVHLYSKISIVVVKSPGISMIFWVFAPCIESSRCNAFQSIHRKLIVTNFSNCSPRSSSFIYSCATCSTDGDGLSLAAIFAELRTFVPTAKCALPSISSA